MNLSSVGNSIGNGSSGILSPTADQVGAFLYRDVVSNGNFSQNNIRLFWNYGNNNITNLNNGVYYYVIYSKNIIRKGKMIKI